MASAGALPRAFWMKKPFESRAKRNEDCAGWGYRPTAFRWPRKCFIGYYFVERCSCCQVGYDIQTGAEQRHNQECSFNKQRQIPVIEQREKIGFLLY